jgi:hypothetical protein
MFWGNSVSSAQCMKPTALPVDVPATFWVQWICLDFFSSKKNLNWSCCSMQNGQATGLCKFHTSDSEYVQSLYFVGVISYVCIVMCENISVYYINKIFTALKPSSWQQKTDRDTKRERQKRFILRHILLRSYSVSRWTKYVDGALVEWYWGEEMEVLVAKPVPVPLVHPESTCAGMGLNPGLCSEMLAINCLSHVMATGCMVEFTEIILENGGP